MLLTGGNFKQEDIDKITEIKKIDTVTPGFRKKFQEKFNSENLLGVTFGGSDEEDRFK